MSRQAAPSGSERYARESRELRCHQHVRFAIELDRRHHIPQWKARLRERRRPGQWNDDTCLQVAKELTLHIDQQRKELAATEVPVYVDRKLRHHHLCQICAKAPCSFTCRL